MFLEFFILMCIVLSMLWRLKRHLTPKSLKGMHETLVCCAKPSSARLSPSFMLSNRTCLVADEIVLITGGASGIGHLVRTLH